MKIKLISDLDKDGIKLIKDSILDVDDVTAKAMIEAKSAIEYVEQVETEQIEVEVNKIMSTENVLEVKDGAEIKVVKDAEPMWKGIGEFMKAVVNAGRGGEVDQRLRKSTGQNETTPADGGYTVTTDIARFITQQAQAASVMEQKCSHLEIGPNYTGIKIPQLQESARSTTTLYGGVRIYSPAEGVAKTPFKQAYYQKDIQLKKLCAVNYVTDELLQDNTALEGFIRMNVGKAFAWAKDNEIINGTLSAATAIVNDGATAEVTFAGANPTAAEINTMFVANMNRNSAEWFLSSKQYGVLLALSNVGTLANLIQPNYTVSAAGTLYGRPINIIEQAGIETDESSFMFLDLKDYLVIGKGGIQEATSIHVKFLEDETCFRWTTRFGGAPLNRATVTMLDGTVQSSLVTRD